MIIDGHAHAAGVFFEADTLIPELDRLGVDKIVLAPMGVNINGTYRIPNIGRLVPGCDLSSMINRLIRIYRAFTDAVYDVPNEYLYRLKQQCPDRIIQFYWANPRDPNIMQELTDHLPLWNYSGVKLHQVISDFDTNQESMHQIAEFCETHDMPLFIHMFKRNNIFEFVDLLKDHPHTKFVVGHLIGFDIIAERAFELNNYWFDISPYALLSEKWVLKAYNKYGASRLLLGSDTPFGNNCLEKNMNRVRNLSITPAEKDQILGENLRGLLGI